MKEFDGYIVSENGVVMKNINANHPKRKQLLIIKNLEDKDGYLYLRINGKKWLIHRLVFMLFNGALIPGQVICHMDGDRKNCHSSNLHQAYQKENISHKKLHGTHQAGEKHGRAQYNQQQVIAVKEALKNAPRSISGRIQRGYSKFIAAQQNVGINLVYEIESKGAWKCL